MEISSSVGFNILCRFRACFFQHFYDFLQAGNTFFPLLNVKHEGFTIILHILPTVAKNQQPFFNLLINQMKEYDF